MLLSQQLMLKLSMVEKVQCLEREENGTSCCTTTAFELGLTWVL